MDVSDSQITPKTEEAEPDLYHRPNRLVRTASFANILSWISLAIVVFFLVTFLVIFYQAIGQGATFMNLLSTIILVIAIVVVGLFFFVLLQAISEGIYLFMDIEENSRKSEE